MKYQQKLRFEPKELLRNGTILVSHWSVVGQLLVSGKWRKVREENVGFDHTHVFSVYSIIMHNMIFG